MSEKELDILDAIDKYISARDQKIRDDIFLLHQYKVAVDESNIVSKTDKNGIITFVNKKFEEISGYAATELIGKNHNIVRHPDMPDAAFRNLWETISAKKTWHGTIKNKKKDGGYYFVDATIIPILNAAGEIEEYMAIRKDVTRLIEQRKVINRQSTDQLTGLSNEIKFEEDLATLEKKTLILLNVDMYREIADFYGLDSGNQLLIEIGQRLRGYIRKNKKYLLYKMRGDEFLLMYKGEQKPHILQDEIFEVCEYLMRSTVKISDDLDIVFSVSAGACSGDEMMSLNKAQVALQFARETKRLFYIYDDILKHRHEHNLKSVIMIKQAIALNKIVPYYQPIVNTETGGVEKFESLARLIDGNTVRSPASFIEIAKKSRLYPHVTKMVIGKVLELAETVDYEFSINLSIEDIIDPKIRRMLVEEIRKYKGRKDRIIFEITETEGISDYTEIGEFVTEMKSFGCKFAIDDFGTGYSNFEYLARLQIDYVKIDGSLISQIAVNESIYKIVQLIVEFARKMGFKSVAEYIDCEKTLTLVRELGIEYSQGYFLGEPLDENLFRQAFSSERALGK